MTDSVVVEGYARLRDGKKVLSASICFADGHGGSYRTHARTQNNNNNNKKKDTFDFTFCFLPQWKTRWLVLRKPSPVAGKYKKENYEFALLSLYSLRRFAHIHRAAEEESRLFNQRASSARRGSVFTSPASCGLHCI